jgi:hypothetical protein
MDKFIIFKELKFFHLSSLLSLEYRLYPHVPSLIVYKMVTVLYCSHYYNKVPEIG